MNPLFSQKQVLSKALELVGGAPAVTLVGIIHTRLTTRFYETSHICKILPSLGLWAVVGGDKDVLLASTIAHSIAAPFHLCGVTFACSHYLVGRKEARGILFINSCNFLLFISGLLYKSALVIDIFTQPE